MEVGGRGQVPIERGEREDPTRGAGNVVEEVVVAKAKTKVKGVIIGAGYGTRFLPVTKTIPKEMVPLVDRPAIDFIIREFIEAGIEDAVFVSSRRKKAIED